MTDVELQIAAQGIQCIPADKPLSDRIKYAMRYAREHEHDVFWMSARVNEDMKMRTALAAVMLAGDESDRDIITRSMKPLRMLSAAMSGIPVDFGAMELSDDLLPIMKLWDESKS
jgi:hypothetical protein